MTHIILIANIAWEKGERPVQSPRQCLEIEFLLIFFLKKIILINRGLSDGEPRKQNWQREPGSPAYHQKKRKEVICHAKPKYSKALN